MRESKQGKRGRPKKNYKTAVIRIHEELKQLLENDADGNHCDLADIASVTIAKVYGRKDIIKQVEGRKRP